MTSIRGGNANVKFVGSFVLLLVVSILLQALLMAQGPKPPKPTNPIKEAANPVVQPTGTHEMTAADVGAFLDGIMPAQLAREDIAGAVIAVVKDGKVIFARGYGYSDVAKRTPVTADGTLFRPGSISKLFTWTAVMQQVEQGKLDLDRDVNDYIDFKIPPFHGKPITLRNAMTHTPGFEETLQELFVADTKNLSPLGTYLKAHLPKRVYEPGTTPAYSNYATVLAGYIVQRVSGEPFDDYIENHILKPLAMNHTTFRQPLPSELKPMMSNGYNVASAPVGKFEFVEGAPAGSSSTTAMDMTRFMMAHLQDGQFEGVQILRPETARLMHTSQSTSPAGMNSMALGFYEETRNGHRIIGHAGDTEYFHSDLHLISDAATGFFISYNSAGKGEISPRNAVFEAFLDRYFPLDDPPAPAAVVNAAQDAQLISGHYLLSRRMETTFMRVLSAIGQTKVYTNSDGTVSVSSLKGYNGQPKKFREIGPLLFQEVNGQDRIAFRRDPNGVLTMAIDFPFMVFQKAAWYDNGSLQLPLAIGSLIIFALTVLLWPLGAFIRKHYGKHLTLTPRQRWLRMLVRVTCAINILFVAGFVIFFSVGMKNIGLLSPKYNYILHLIQLLGWLGVAGMVVVVYNMVSSWKVRDRWIGSKLGDTVVALACVGFFWFVVTWNLLHWVTSY